MGTTTIPFDKPAHTPTPMTSTLGTTAGFSPVWNSAVKTVSKRLTSTRTAEVCATVILF